AKYGALSVPAGRIEIRWQPSRDEAGEPQLTIDWQETGGPPVNPPERRGFGSRLIEGSIAAEFSGNVRLIFDPAGLRCEMRMPVSAVAADGPGKRHEDGIS
ncbi:MAG TPA: sensor histidine kinase, partial [Pseudolabrys sp.]|nr:sensor histidine kinase [Pseudolabrys sp.]